MVGCRPASSVMLSGVGTTNASPELADCAEERRGGRVRFMTSPRGEGMVRYLIVPPVIVVFK